MMTKLSAFLVFAMVGSFCFTSGEAQALTVRGRRAVHHHRHAVRANAHPRPVARVAAATVHAAAPVVVAPARKWVPGHYETVTDTVVVKPGHYENQYVEPQYETVVHADGSTSEVLVSEGHYEKVWVAAESKLVTRKVWIKGHYAS